MQMTLAGAIYETFSTDEGKSVLQWILNECTFFETRPDKISPEKLAFAHKLLNAGNFTINGDSGRFVDAIVNSHDRSGDYEK